LRNLGNLRKTLWRLRRVEKSPWKNEAAESLVPIQATTRPGIVMRAPGTKGEIIKLSGAMENVGGVQKKENAFDTERNRFRMNWKKERGAC
jgi:hypothetical protein